MGRKEVEKTSAEWPLKDVGRRRGRDRLRKRVCGMRELEPFLFARVATI